MTRATRLAAARASCYFRAKFTHVSSASRVEAKMVASTQDYAVPKRQFVPAKFDVSDWSQIQPLADELLVRKLHSADDLKKWLADFSELTSVIDEYGSRKHIDKSCHTEDTAIEKA